MENTDNILSEFIPDETEVSFVQGLLTRLIDIAIEIGLIFLFYVIVARTSILVFIGDNSLIRWFFVILIVVIYQFSFLFLFNKTFGMMVCRVKYLNRDLRPLSTKEKLMSLFRSRFSSIRYYKDK